MKICQMLPDDRPREKMLIKGAEALSNTELVALVLRTGTGKQNAIDIARNLLAENENSLTVLSSLSIDKLKETPGIGSGKAVLLAGVFELSKRLLAEEPSRQKTVLSDAAMVYLYMEPRLSMLDHEEAWILYLTKGCRLIRAERLSSGGHDETTADIKDILKKTLEKHASKIILIHNHPDGDPHPGSMDIKLTMRLKSALQTTGIQLLDHIIIGHRNFYSFAEERVLSESQKLF